MRYLNRSQRVCKLIAEFIDSPPEILPHDYEVPGTLQYPKLPWSGTAMGAPRGGIVGDKTNNLGFMNTLKNFFTRPKDYSKETQAPTQDVPASRELQDRLLQLPPESKPSSPSGRSEVPYLNMRIGGLPYRDSVVAAPKEIEDLADKTYHQTIHPSVDTLAQTY